MSTRGVRLASVLFFVSLAQARATACDPASTFAEATRLLSDKQYDKAASALDQLHTCAHLSPIDLFQLGWLYGRARHFDKALAAFDQVPPDIPDRLTHGYAVALSKFELSDYRGAISILEPLRSLGVTDTKSSNLLAVSYSKLAEYKQADAILSQRIEKDPTDLETNLNLITVCAEGGDVSRAADLASRAASRFPQSPEVIVVRGATQSLLGRSDEAAQDFAAAVRLAPDRPDARFFLALMDYNLAKYPQAIEVLRKANADGLRDSDLHYLLAECLLKIDAANTDAALAELNAAVEMNPNSVAAKTLRGRLLLDRGSTKEAIADLEFAHREDPGSRSAVYTLARAYRSAGKNAEATALFQQLRSGNPDAVKELGDRRLSETLTDKGAQQ